MNTFAEYILNEKNLSSKIEIVYYLAKKEKIFFDKTVIFKTELARLFLKHNKLDLDENLVLTACLLCNCKKCENVKELNKVKSYAKEGAIYLETLGFNKRFCKICEEVNRYSDSKPREKESDILELVDQFGGMLLDRTERIGFKPDEALVLLTHRNLKGKYNRYSEIFVDFVNMLEEIKMGEFVNDWVLNRLKRIYSETPELIEFIKRLINEYEPKVDNLINRKYKKIKEEMFIEAAKNNIPLFTEETTRKILKDIEVRKQMLEE